MHLSFSYASKETRLLPSPISDYRLRFAIISPSIATESNKQLEQNQVYYYSVEKIRFFQSKYSFHDLFIYIYIYSTRSNDIPSKQRSNFLRNFIYLSHFQNSKLNWISTSILLVPIVIDSKGRRSRTKVLGYTNFNSTSLKIPRKSEFTNNKRILARIPPVTRPI